MNATVALEQQKYGEKDIDIQEWWELFDEERAPQYDDLAHYPATEREERAYQRAVDEFLEFGPWPE